MQAGAHTQQRQRTKGTHAAKLEREMRLQGTNANAARKQTTRTLARARTLDQLSNERTTARSVDMYHFHQ